MFDKLMIPLKLTLEFDTFLEYLCSIPEFKESELHLVNVFPVSNQFDADTLDLLEKDTYEKQKEILVQRGYKVFLHNTFGQFHREINRIAEENDIDLIVTGSQSEFLISELVLDPRSDDLIRNARFPLLTLSCQRDKKTKEVTYQGKGDRLFKQILFPTDFSDNAELALDYVLKPLVAKTQASVYLLHVQEHKRIHPHLISRLEEFNMIDKERMERIKTALLQAGASAVEYEIIYGHAVLEILNTIGKQQPGIVIMGNQGRGQIKEILLGSVAHQIARKAKVPVLLVPQYLDDTKLINKGDQNV